jgi:beta-glucosidase
MTTATVPYRDPSLAIDTRVADLLGRMTLDEKLAQLGSAWSFQLIDPAVRLDPQQADRILRHGLGHVTRIAGGSNLAAADVARAGNEIQRYLLERTRLGIPALLHEETLHGLLARDAPSFQQSIGAAAAWDPGLVLAMAETLRRRMLATGARVALAPVLDVTRDPRWGRIEETYGEDPYLATVFGLAYVRGLQGDDLRDGVVATGKHMVGHGLAEGGLNQAPVHIGPRELRDEQLLPFEAAVRVAGLAAMMPAYCDVDGVPCHVSSELLTSILREEWGFDGLVVSDYTALSMLVTEHRLSADLATVAAMALRAGVDAEWPSTSAFGDPLRRAVGSGDLEEAVVDAAVARTLRLKFRLGLFERPYVDVPEAADLSALSVDEQAIARTLARRSLVLVENDGILPLRADLARIAVIGPAADSARELLGDYDHLLHIETLREMRSRDNPLGFPLDADIQPVDELTGRQTILDALRARFASAGVVHAAGGGLRSGTDADIDAAVAVARDADVAILCLGERSGLTDDATTGEFRDRSTLGLLGRQQELLEAVVATGTPVVLVVVSGRPLALSWAAEHCAAILLAWVPGEAGPAAVADVLSGDADAAGRLPISMPRHVGQIPLSYRHHPTGGRSNWKGDYVDGPATPLWAFGSGRSYTTTSFERLGLDRTSLDTRGDTVEISVEVTNTGRRAGEEVVQLYVRDEEATAARPVRELAGFQRLVLAPSECQRVTFHLSTEAFLYTGADRRRVIEPGSVTIAVGRSSTDLPLQATLQLVGPTVEVRDRRHYVTPTDVA